MKLVNRFRQLSTTLLYLHITAKFIFGVGLGVLLAGHLRGFGWWLIVLSLMVSIPSSYKIFSGK